jgi:hypothetical protein
VQGRLRQLAGTTHSAECAGWTNQI